MNQYQKIESPSQTYPNGGTADGSDETFYSCNVDQPPSRQQKIEPPASASWSDTYSDDGAVVGSVGFVPSVASDEAVYSGSVKQPPNHYQNIKPPVQTYPNDGSVVGSDAIFYSCNVEPPQNVVPQEVIPFPMPDDGIPAPSIYYDNRGEIHNIKVCNKRRINILYTKAGYLRSGDLHPNEQCDFIFSGKIKLWTLAKDGTTTTKVYGKHEYISIARGVPHVFEFIEDTIMAEWWEPQGFQAWFYKPYRDIVNKCMLIKGMSEGKRRHKGLVVLSPSTEWKSASIMLGAAFVGMVGFALGSRFGSRGIK